MDLEMQTRCLMAFRLGDDTIEAELGARLLAEALLIFRRLHTKR